MGFIAAYEAMVFQGKTPLAIELTKVFQKVIDHKYKLIGDAGKEVYADVATSTVKFFIKECAPKMLDIISKETGLDYRRLTVSKQANGMFATLFTIVDKDKKTAKDIKMSDVLKTKTIEDNYTGKKQNPYNPYKSVRSIDREAISKILDKDMGKLVKEVGGKHRFLATLYFDPVTAFLSDLVLDATVEPMTADEIASIVIHEVGHSIQFLDYVNNRVRHVEMFNDYVTTELTDKTISPQQKARRLKELSVIALSQKNNKELQKVGKQIESGLEAYEDLKKTNAKNPSIAMDAGATLLNGLIAAGLAVEIGRSIIVNYVVHGLVDGFSAIFSGENYKKKTSDYLGTDHDYVFIERKADEFVSNHGLGGAVASGLEKFSKLLGPEQYTIGKSTRVAGMFKSVMRSMFDTYMKLESIGHPLYESEIGRAGRLMQNSIKVMKQAKLPKEMVDFYLKDYERSKKIYDANIARAKKKSIVLHTVEFLVLCANPGNVLKIFLGKNMDKRYKKYMDIIDELTNSQLLYTATKIGRFK